MALGALGWPWVPQSALCSRSCSIPAPRIVEQLALSLRRGRVVVIAWFKVPLGTHSDGGHLRAGQSPMGHKQVSGQLWVPLGILHLEPPPAQGEHIELLMK